MTDVLITAENIGKKFCRSLKRSLMYGMIDLGTELIGSRKNHRELRKEEFWAIKDITLELKRGETLGLIGRNGAGKTTFLRLLNGLIKPDAGRVEVRGRMQALIALGAGFNPILTGRENIYVNAAVLGIPKTVVNQRLEEIIEFSGIHEFIDTPVQSYSSGMAVRLGFSVAAHMSPDILLVDEVLAVGDHGFQSKCFNKIGELRDGGTAIILVSHNMHTISTFSNRVVLLNNGRHQLYENVPEGIDAYNNLFMEELETDIEKVRSGNEKIRFFDVNIHKRMFKPGDSFSISIPYESDVDYSKVEIDLVIYSSSQPGLYFQATNKAYQREINLYRGNHELCIEIENLNINNAIGKVVISIWTHNRSEYLFWWRIPVQFTGVPYSTGSNFHNVVFEDR